MLVWERDGMHGMLAMKRIPLRFPAGVLFVFLVVPPD